MLVETQQGIRGKFHGKKWTISKEKNHVISSGMRCEKYYTTAQTFNTLTMKRCKSQ